jgi:hypothetical protein
LAETLDRQTILVTLSDPRIAARVDAVSLSGGNVELQFAKKLGELSLPPQTTGNPDFVTKDTPVSITRESAFVAVPADSGAAVQLRYYRTAKSTTADGVAVFEDPSNYAVSRGTFGRARARNRFRSPLIRRWKS